MAHAHNLILRGLNAILQQAPNVPAAPDPRFNAQDVKDLLFYVQSWVKVVHHHHWVEESFVFPEIERFTGRPDFMDQPKHQHELFHDGMEALAKYAAETKPGDYRWEGGMKGIIDSFSKHLTDHLYAEIDICLGMADVDDKGLKDTWANAEKIAKETGEVAMLVSCSEGGGLNLHLDVAKRLTEFLDYSMTCSP